MKTYKGILFGTPWIFDCIRTSVLSKECRWIHENKKNKNMDFWDKNKWKDIILYKSYPYIYTDKYNKTQNCIATYYIVEREWRLKFFKWFKPIRKVSREIEVEFSSDGKNTFNGECKSCSYTILKGEHDKETLMRMEKNKKF